MRFLGANEVYHGCASLAVLAQIYAMRRVVLSSLWACVIAVCLTACGQKIMRLSAPSRVALIGGWTKDEIRAISSAVDEWNSASDALARFVIDSDRASKDVDVNRRFVETTRHAIVRVDAGDERNLAPAFGVNDWRGIYVADTGSIYIRTNTVKASALYGPYPNELRLVALHEMGHMFGLEHHSSGKWGIMSTLIATTCITRHDIDALCKVADCVGHAVKTTCKNDNGRR